MIQINNGSINQLMKASNKGPFMQAEIVSLLGIGKVRVKCDVFNGCLYCTPSFTGDGSDPPFLWQFTKVDDEHITLSPVDGCFGLRLYASVRDDNNYHLQTQAPNSDNWITAIGRDEIIGFKMHDMSIASFKGFNGKYFQSNKDGETNIYRKFFGWRIRSASDKFGLDSQWLIVVKSSLQSHINFSGGIENTATLETHLKSANIKYDNDLLSNLSAQLF